MPSPGTLPSSNDSLNTGYYTKDGFHSKKYWTECDSSNNASLPQLPPNAIIESDLHLADGLVQPQGIRVPAPLAEIMMDIDETNRLAALAATGDWSALREAVEVDPALEGLDRLYVQEVVRRLVQLNGDILSRLVDDEEF